MCCNRDTLVDLLYMYVFSLGVNISEQCFVPPLVINSGLINLRLYNVSPLLLHAFYRFSAMV